MLCLFPNSSVAASTKSSPGGEAPQPVACRRLDERAPIPIDSRDRGTVLLSNCEVCISPKSGSARMSRISYIRFLGVCSLPATIQFQSIRWVEFIIPVRNPLKYRSWDWTWGKTPAFSYEREGRFAGQPLRVAYRAKKGILSDVCLESPLIDAGHAAHLLNGSRLDPDGFSKICFALAGERAQELMELLM